MLAANRGQLDLVRLLLAHGARVDVVDARRLDRIRRRPRG